MNVKKLSDIKASPIIRNRTFFTQLDMLYGTSDLKYHSLGMPKGKISLWAGESGVGKSRLCIEVAKRFSTEYSNGVVLYFQTEAPLEDFASWAKNTKEYDRIYCSGENNIDEIVKTIYEVKPKLIFIDSVNEIDEFENGSKKEARRIIKGVDGKPGLREATYTVGAHLILLGQLNQDGKTIKGGTSLPHLVDIALNVVKTDRKDVFRVEVGTKHRYGSKDGMAEFRHTEDGVIEIVPTVPVPMPETVSQEIDPEEMPAMYFGEDILLEPLYAGDQLWTIKRQRHYLDLKAKKVASGEIKLDENDRIIPTKDKKSLLRRLNKGVGNMFGLGT